MTNLLPLSRRSRMSALLTCWRLTVGSCLREQRELGARAHFQCSITDLIALTATCQLSGFEEKRTRHPLTFLGRKATAPYLVYKRNARIVRARSAQDVEAVNKATGPGEGVTHNQRDRVDSSVIRTTGAGTQPLPEAAGVSHSKPTAKATSTQGQSASSEDGCTQRARARQGRSGDKAGGNV